MWRICRVWKRLILVCDEYVLHCVCICANYSDSLSRIAYQVARAIADVHDVEDDGYASIAHSE
jgi:hypothetical protein